MATSHIAIAVGVRDFVRGLQTAVCLRGTPYVWLSVHVCFLVQLLPYKVTINISCLHTPKARMRPLFAQPTRNQISVQE
jgi:hypothetical protein